MSKLIYFIFLFLAFNSGDVDADAKDAISKIDAIRFPQVDYIANLTITQIKPNKDNRIYKYELLAKGREMALLKTTEPLNEKGRVVLMKGLDTWIYLPTISQPIRLSLRERLLGDIAVGDIARANFSGDYDSVFLKEDVINGTTYNVFDLTAVNDQIPYAKALVWARNDNFQPYQSHFFGNSGKLLKIARYDKYQDLAGMLRPTRLIMSDPVKSGQHTVVDYNEIYTKELPDQYFTSSYIGRLSD